MRYRPLSSAWPLLVFLVGMVSAIIALVGEVDGFVAWAEQVLDFPFGRDRGEGLLLGLVQEARAGRTLYSPVDAEPWVVCNYPPLYPLATAVLTADATSSLRVGRLISFVGALAAGLFVGLSVLGVAARAPSGDRAPAALSWLVVLLAAAVAGLATVSLAPVEEWGVLMRVDVAALALSLAGLASFLALSHRRRAVYLCLVPFLLAAFTKHSLIAFPAACLLAAIRHAPAHGLRLTATYLGVGLLIFFGLDSVLDGRLFFHLVSANRTQYSAELGRYWLTRLLTEHGVLMAAATGGWLLAWKARPQPGSRLACARSTWLCLWPLSLATIATAGKSGSNWNYMLEVLAAACLGTGILLADLGRRLIRPSAMPWAALGCAAVLLGYVLSPWSEVRQDGRKGRAGPPTEVQRQTGELILEHLRQVKGDFLSEEMSLAPLIGRRLDFHPFTMPQLARRGLWDETPLLERLRRRDYELVILTFDAESPPADLMLMFTPAMVREIAASYREVVQYGGLRFYRPR